MSDEKSFQYAKRISPVFRALVKFCSTNRLFKASFVACQALLRGISAIYNLSRLVGIITLRDISSNSPEDGLWALSIS